MSLPPMDGVSSSTPRRSRPKLRTSRSLPPPPPEEIEMYWKRPLPPLPQRRNSVLLAFRKEVDEALATPEPVVRLENGTIQLIFSGKTLPDGAQAEISFQTDTCLDKTRCRKGLKINTGFIRAEESHSPTFTHLHSELQLDGEVSPLSDDTGDYSPRGPSTAVSSVDDDVEDDASLPTTFRGTPGTANVSKFCHRLPEKQQQQMSTLPSPSRSSSASCTRFTWSSDAFPHGTMSSSGTAGPVSISTGSDHMNGAAGSSTSARHHKANQPHFFEHLCPGPAALDTKTPMSGLVTRTADLVDSAASTMDGTLNGRKRRKWRLKSNFLGSEDGAQSFAPKSS
ncbi:hypothetical protein VTH82DRAFT_3794 [Thermothelomyces myriococcoides]